MNKKTIFGLAAIVLVSLACAMTPAAGTLQPTLTVPPAPTAAATLAPTSVPATQAPAPTATTPALPTSAPATAAPTTAPVQTVGPYAVVLVDEGDALNVRSAPGTGSAIVTTLRWDQTGVMLTGKTQVSGGATWAEVSLASGATGWVNTEYLTEWITPEAFCADARVSDLLAQLAFALEAQDGNALAGLVSPKHGMNVNYFHSGNTIRYSAEQAKFLFTSTYAANWGTHPASGLEEKGAFHEKVVPMLLDVLSREHQVACNDPALGPHNYTFYWPARYQNFHYYALLRPGTPGTELDWRTWLVGVEYVNGKPYVVALIHLFWEP